MSTTAPRVCIIGAGVAGPTLARVLAINGIHPVILERVTSSETREQGVTLDLKRDSGQVALKIANLYGEFQTFMRKEGQDIKMMYPSGTVVITPHMTAISTQRSIASS